MKWIEIILAYLGSSLAFDLTSYYEKKYNTEVFDWIFPNMTLEHIRDLIVLDIIAISVILIGLKTL